MKAQRVCYIFGAGTYYGPPPAPRVEDYVIAADGGYRYAQEAGLRVDLVVGDFDSLAQPPQHENVLRLPPEKDDTDMLAAIHAGLEQGLLVFHIYGGTGGRLDHTLANIQCIAALAARGARGYLHDQGTVITAISDGQLSFPAGGRGTVSVFSHSDISQGVSESGFAYSLSDATLTNRTPLGISNAFTDRPGRISVRSGTLVVIYPEDTPEVKS